MKQTKLQRRIEAERRMAANAALRRRSWIVRLIEVLFNIS
jgi:hypothetical protein